MVCSDTDIPVELGFYPRTRSKSATLPKEDKSGGPFFDPHEETKCLAQRALGGAQLARAPRACG